MKKDRVFKNKIKKISDFVFDDKVASAFDDMLERSVPAYTTLIQMIELIASRVIQKNTNCYDLGSSLGAASLSILKSAERKKATIIAIDSSKAMMKRFKKVLKKIKPKTEIILLTKKIEKVKMERASLILLNLTLQFIDPEHRDSLVKKIYKALLPGGVLVLTEKIIFEDEEKQKRFTSYYEHFKRINGYSKLEISQKRSALENVLIPETIETHKKRLQRAGFTSVDIWFQSLTFVSFVCIKK